MGKKVDTVLNWAATVAALLLVSGFLSVYLIDLPTCALFTCVEVEVGEQVAGLTYNGYEFNDAEGNSIPHNGQVFYGPTVNLWDMGGSIEGEFVVANSWMTPLDLAIIFGLSMFVIFLMIAIMIAQAVRIRKLHYHMDRASSGLYALATAEQPYGWVNFNTNTSTLWSRVMRSLRAEDFS